jgi:hypothetical protein
MPLCPPLLDAPPAPEVPPVLVAPPVPLIPAVPASGAPAVPPPPMLAPVPEPPVPTAPPVPLSDLELPFGREEHAARASPRKMPTLATLFMDSFNAFVGRARLMLGARPRPDGVVSIAMTRSGLGREHHTA